MVDEYKSISGRANLRLNRRELLLILGNREDKVTTPLRSVGYDFSLIKVDKMGLIKLALMFRLLYVLLRERPLVLSDYPGGLSFAVLLLCKLLRLPFVLRLRGDIWLEFKQISLFNRIIRSFIADFLLQHSSKILPVSLSLVRIIESRKQVASNKVRVIGISRECGTKVIVSSEAVTHIQVIKEKHRYVLLTITNFNFLGKVKGLLELVPILEELINKKNLDICWVIIGGGKYKNQFLQNISQFHNVAIHVDMMGHVHNASALMQYADLVVYFSREDAAPNVVLESMCAGKVTVVNDYPPLMDIISDGETGIIVEPACVSSATDAIADALLDTEKASAIGVNARKWAVENFDNQRIGKKFVEALNEAI